MKKLLLSKKFITYLIILSSILYYLVFIFKINWIVNIIAKTDYMSRSTFSTNWDFETVNIIDWFKYSYKIDNDIISKELIKYWFDKTFIKNNETKLKVYYIVSNEENASWMYFKWTNVILLYWKSKEMEFSSVNLNVLYHEYIHFIIWKMEREQKVNIFKKIQNDIKRENDNKIPEMTKDNKIEYLQHEFVLSKIEMLLWWWYNFDDITLNDVLLYDFNENNTKTEILFEEMIAFWLTDWINWGLSYFKNWINLTEWYNDVFNIFFHSTNYNIK